MKINNRLHDKYKLLSTYDHQSGADKDNDKWDEFIFIAIDNDGFKCKKYKDHTNLELK